MKKLPIALCTVLTMLLLSSFSACSERTPNGVTVTFDTGFSDVVTEPVFLDGSEKYMPDEPFKVGYTFDGWYYDAAYTRKFSATDGFTRDTTLYAKWTERIPDLPDSGPTEEVDEAGVHYLLSGETYTVVSYDGTATDLVLPSTHNGKQVTKIKSGAFTGSLAESVYIPEAVTEIENNAFSGAYYISALSVPPSHPSFSTKDGILYSKDGTVLLCVPRNNRTEFALPDAVTSIGAYALARCKCTLSFGKNSSCLRLGNYALAAFDGKVILSNNISELLKNAFTGATCEIVFENSGLTALDMGDFDGYNGGKLVLPANIDSIQSHAFENCTADVSFESGSKLTAVSSYAFANFAGNLTLPDSVNSVENYAFRGAKATAKITFSTKKSQVTLSKDAFALCNAVVEYVE